MGRWARHLGWYVWLLVFLVEAHGAEMSSLERLFTTPQERLELNAARRYVVRRMSRHRGERNHEEALAAESLTVNGVMIRSGGPPAVWLDGGSALVEGGGLPRGVKRVGRGKDAALFIQLPHGNGEIKMKPGQRLDGATGSILEAYEADAMEEDGLKAEGETQARKESQTGHGSGSK